MCRAANKKNNFVNLEIDGMCSRLLSVDMPRVNILSIINW